MSDFSGKNVQNLILAGAPPQTLYGEFTEFPLTPWLHLRGHTSKGRGGEGNVNEGENGGRKKEFAPNIHHRSTPLSVMDVMKVSRPTLL